MPLEMKCTPSASSRSTSSGDDTEQCSSTQHLSTSMSSPFMSHSLCRPIRASACFRLRCQSGRDRGVNLRRLRVRNQGPVRPQGTDSHGTSRGVLAIIAAVTHWIFPYYHEKCYMKVFSKLRWCPYVVAGGHVGISVRGSWYCRVLHCRSCRTHSTSAAFDVWHAIRICRTIPPVSQRTDACTAEKTTLCEFWWASSTASSYEGLFRFTPRALSLVRYSARLEHGLNCYVALSLCFYFFSVLMFLIFSAIGQCLHYLALTKNSEGPWGLFQNYREFQNVYTPSERSLKNMTATVKRYSQF